MIRFIALFTVTIFFSLPAQALSIDPSLCGAGPTDLTCYTTNTNSNLGSSSDIETAFGVSFDPDLSLYYKSNFIPGQQPGGGDTGTFRSNYSTLFNATSNPSGAAISHDSGEPAISCPECYLLVKDGRATPAQYLISLSSWDGLEALTLSGFWDDTQGAISNVAIWGNVSPVPVPAAAWLFGTALIGFIGMSRRTKV
jgi:hypothetical protein